MANNPAQDTLTEMRECVWCGWTGTKAETEPLGSLTEDDDLAESMRECPECGDPSPRPIEDDTT